MFSTIKDICKLTFSITKNTVELSGNFLDALEERMTALIWLCKLNEKIRKSHLTLSLIPDEVMISFGGVESLKNKIIKYINNNIDKTNNKFNTHIYFIEELSLDDFERVINSINVDNLSENKVEELFNELNSIELISKTNKDKIEELLESLNPIESTLKTNKDKIEELRESASPTESKLNKDKVELLETLSLIPKNNKESITNKLIELLNKDETFNSVIRS